MLGINKSNWKRLVKEEDRPINKLKVALLDAYKEFYKATGDNSVLHFLEQSFELILDDKSGHRKRIFKITDEANFEFSALGWGLKLGYDIVIMDGIFEGCLK